MRKIKYYLYPLCLKSNEILFLSPLESISSFTGSFALSYKWEICKFQEQNTDH